MYNRNRPAPANVTVFCDTYTGLEDEGREKGFLIFAVHGKIVQVQKISIITREGRVEFPGGGLEDSVISRGWANWPETKSLLWSVRNGTTQCEMEVLDCETGTLILRLVICKEGGGTVGLIPFISVFRIA